MVWWQEWGQERHWGSRRHCGCRGFASEAAVAGDLLGALGSLELAFASAGEPGVRSLAWGCWSYRPVNAVASDSARPCATSSSWLAKPSVVGDDGHDAHRGSVRPGEAWADRAAAAGST